MKEQERPSSPADLSSSSRWRPTAVTPPWRLGHGVMLLCGNPGSRCGGSARRERWRARRAHAERWAWPAEPVVPRDRAPRSPHHSRTSASPSARVLPKPGRVLARSNSPARSVVGPRWGSASRRLARGPLSRGLQPRDLGRRTVGGLSCLRETSAGCEGSLGPTMNSIRASPRTGCLRPRASFGVQTRKLFGRVLRKFDLPGEAGIRGSKTHHGAREPDIGAREHREKEARATCVRRTREP
jgi:hypothetical protein